MFLTVRWLVPAMITMMIVMIPAVSGCGGDVEDRANAGRAEMTVFAAASLTEAMTDAAAVFESSSGVSVRLSFGSSSTLARQIEHGAPAHLYASANPEWMDYLDERRLIDRDSRRDLLANRLVLIADRNGADSPREIRSDLDLPTLFEGRLAVADPSHVPAGRYAKQAIEHFGWWGSLENRLATATDVKAALRLVEIGECKFGIVYRTDALATDRVTIVGIFPQQSHDSIVYPFALVADAPAAAEDFLAFLASADGAAVFEEYGFEVISSR